MCTTESKQEHLFYTGESFCTFRDPGLGVWLFFKNHIFTWVGKILEPMRSKWEGKTEKFHQRVIPPSTPLKGNVSDETNNHWISKKQITRSKNELVCLQLFRNKTTNCFCKKLLRVQIRKSFSKRNSHLIIHSTNTRVVFRNIQKIKHKQRLASQLK